MDDDFARDLLMALPPMESREWTMTKGDLNKLSLYSDEASKSRNQKMCTSEARATSPISASLGKALQEHTNLYIQKGNVNARYTINEEGEIVTVRTCAETLSPHNCSSGCWTAEWVLAVNGTSGDLSGKVSLHVYYYEDGSNVQMRSSREFASESFSGSDADSLAKAVVDQVSKWEVIVFAELSSLYEEDEMESKLRRIRRILPITKTRFKWDAAAQASVKLLNARSK
jgi:F-actin capping protein alpha subunit